MFTSSETSASILIAIILLLSLGTNRSFALLPTPKQQKATNVKCTNQGLQRQQQQQPLVNCQMQSSPSSPSIRTEASLDRRQALSFIALLVPTSTSSFIQPAIAEDTSSSSSDRGIITIKIPTPSTKAGLQLIDTTIGSPPRPVVAIKSVLPNGGVGFTQNAQPGMIVLDYDSAKDVVDKIKNGPYPVELRLKNLAVAAGGDAIGDLGRPLISAEDALRAAEQMSAEDRVAALLSKSGEGKSSAAGGGGEGLAVRVVKKAEGECAIQSRRGDVMEIKYIARIGGKDGFVYDSSQNRGFNYVYQLGNGDMIPGVDLGTYDMCPGEVRELDIPSQLGYGARGSKLFDIPGGSRLWWKIELVSLNFIREGQNDRGRDELYDGGSGSLPIYN